MPKRFDLLVFDWDGTLIDSAAAIVESVQGAARDLGLRVPDDEAARYIIGLGLADALGRLFPEADAALFPQIADRYRVHFFNRDADIPLFTGASELVRDVRERGFLLAVATGKSRRGLERALGQTGLGDLFHGTRCADEGFAKPHPDMLLYLMELLGVEAERTLMIGDTTHDLEMASSARVAGVAVTYGAHSREALLNHGPLALVHSVSELAAWLRENA